MAKNDFMNVSATNEMQIDNNSTNRRKTVEGITARAENRLKRAFAEFGKAVAAFFDPIKKFAIMAIIIAAIVLGVLIILAAGYKYILKLDANRAEEIKTKILKGEEARLLMAQQLYGYKGQTSDLEEFAETVDFFLREDDQTFTRVATTSRAKKITTLDNFLFIGDSRYEAIEAQLNSLGTNIVAKGVGSSFPENWIKPIENGGGNVARGIGEGVETRDIGTLPTSVNGVSVMLGVNGVTMGDQVSDMEDVLNALHTKYPNAPIIVNSVYHLGKNYSGDEDKMNAAVDDFNNKMKNFCNKNDWAVYIDITNGLHDESGYLQYSTDGLHLNDLEGKGNQILVENIKKSIMNLDVNISSNNTQNSGSVSGGRTTETIKIEQNDDGEYCIVNKLDEKVNKIYESLKKDKNTLLKQFDNEKHAKESIKLWIIAEYSSQYVNLSSEVEDYKHDSNADYIQGIVKVKRYGIDENGNETSKYLTYVLPERFEELKENYRTEEDATVFNHFTINKQDDIVIATYSIEEQIIKWEGEVDPNPITTEKGYRNIKIEDMPLNYRSEILPYTMPYFLFVALTMYGEDADFTNEVAKLIIDSEMVIGIRDNVTTTITKKEDTYLKEEYTYEKAKVEAKALSVTKAVEKEFHKYFINPAKKAKTTEFNAQELADIKSQACYKKIITKTETTNYVVKGIEYIDGWCFNHEMEYTPTNITSETKNENEVDDTAYKTPEGYPGINKKNITDNNEIKTLLKDSGNLKSVYDEAVKAIKDEQRYNILIDYYGKIVQEVNNKPEYIVLNSKYNLAALLAYGRTPDYSIIDEEYLETNGIEETVDEFRKKVKDEYERIKEKYQGNQEEIVNKAITTQISEYIRKKQERTVNRKIVTTTTTNRKEYIKGTTKTNEKTDKNPKEGEENFVSILCNPEYRNVKYQLTGSTASWFFETLESEQETAGMIELMKYLFYKTTNKDYGVTEFDFDFTIKNINGMNSISSLYGGDILTRFTMAWEGTQKDAEGNYVIHRASTDPTIGYGIYLYYNLQYFQEAGFFEGVTLEQWQGELYNKRKTQQGERLCDLDGTVLTNADIDKVKNNIVKAHKESVKNYLKKNNINDLEEYQIDALVQVNYQNGNIDALKNYYPDNMEVFFLSWWKDGQLNRKQTVLDLWNTGVYKDKNGNEIVSGVNGDFIPTEDAGATSGIAGYFTSGGRTYTIYLQTRGPWANQEYYYNGAKTISSSGCGMVSTLNIATGLGCTYDPVAFRDAYTGGGWSGLATPMATCLINNFGTDSSIAWSGGYNKTDMIQHLQQGYPIIVLVNNYYLGTHFYGGHYFTILGISEDGKQVFVGDSGNMYLTGWYNVDDVIKTGLTSYLKVY